MNSSNKRFFTTVFIFLLTLIFYGNKSVLQEVYEIRFATIAPDGTPWSDQLKEMKKRVEKEGNGRIKFVVYTSGQLGGEIETLRSLQRGRIQAWGGSVGAVTAIVPELQLLELPYLFLNEKETDYILDNVVFKPYSDILAMKGFILHSWNENGWRHFATKKKPIFTPSDLKGLKIRSQESQIHIEMWKAFGASPVPISIPEVMSALQTGLVDGFDNSTLFTSATGWYQSVDHFVLSAHMYQPGLIIYNKKYFDSLPQDIQKILLGDQKYEAQLGRKGVREIEPEIIKILEKDKVKVHKMSAAQREEFAKLARTIHPKFRNIVGAELYDKVQNALRDFRNKSGSK
ncbi:MAG: TRAP transporter substrate-binding protein [Ignavibacteriales bacterium]|nr:TRAP transporter substrate-binding protein [Ignavibacteriales bacterium]